VAIKNKLKADSEGTIIKDSQGNEQGISYNKLPTWLSSEAKSTPNKASAVSSGTSGATGATNNNANSENDYINRVADLQKIAKESEYENAYNKVMSQIEEARAKTAAEYQAKRNDADVSNQIQQKNYFENVANRGQTNSGSTSQGELALKISGMNNQSALRAGEAQAMADLNRDATNAYSDYINNVAQSNANIDIQRYQNLLEQHRIDQERASKEAKEAFEREIATIAQYDADYAAEIQRREALNPNDPLIPYLKIARQEKLDELERGLQEKEKANQEALEKEIKVLMQLKDYDALDALGYDTSLLRKESALDIANIQSLINSRNIRNSTEGNQTYQNILNKVQELNSSAGEDYSENLASARYLLNSDLTMQNVISIMKQTNVRPEAFVREMVNEGIPDEDVVAFIESYTPKQNYRDALYQYAHK
jgi:hypothetical protein